jgi:hypothetical protein
MSGHEPEAQGARRAVPSAWQAVLIAGLVLAVAAGLLAMPIPGNYRARWFDRSMDFCHVPLFGLITYLFLRYCWPHRFWTVIAGALFFAAAAELIQPYIGRSGSWHDMIYGAIGVTIAAVAARRAWPVAIRGALMAALAAPAVIETAPPVIDGYLAYRHFPVLAGDQGLFERERWVIQKASLVRGRNALEITYRPMEEGASRAILFPVVRDWSAYDRLEVDFSFDGEPLRFLIAVSDGVHPGDERPAYHDLRTYQPRRHLAVIKLDDLARGGSFQPVDLKGVWSVQLRALVDEPRSIRLHSMRLANGG